MIRRVSAARRLLEAHSFAATHAADRIPAAAVPVPESTADGPGNSERDNG